MTRALVLCLLAALALAAPAHAQWSRPVVTNLFGKPLDPTAYSSPSDQAVPLYGTSSAKWGTTTSFSSLTSFPTGKVAGRTTAGAGAIEALTPSADLLVSAGAIGLTVTTVTAGTYGDGQNVAQFTVDARGRLTAAGTAAISVANAQVQAGAAIALTKLANIAGLSVAGNSGSSAGSLAAITGTADQLFAVNHTGAALGFVTVGGDATFNGTTGAFTLASVVSASTAGDSTHVPQITYDAKGRITGVTSVLITGAAGSIVLKSDASTVDAAMMTLTVNGTNFAATNVGTGLDVLAIATNGVTSSCIAAQSVGISKMTMNTAKLLGRTTASSGAAEEIGVDATMTLSAVTLGVANNGVTLAKMATLTGLSLIGSSGTSTATPVAITGTANQIPIVNSAGTTLAFVTVSGDVTNATGVFTIANLAVTEAKMAAAATNRLMVTPATVGRISLDGGSGAAATALAQGTTGQLLKSAGVAANPAFADPPFTSASGGYVDRNSTNLRLLPDKSNRVFCYENSVWTEKVIPDAGITAACTSLASHNTVYYLYVYDSSGTLTLDLSTTGTTTQNGVLVKSGTTSRTFLALCFTNNSGDVLTKNENAAYQCVCNQYNAREITVTNADSATTSGYGYAGNWRTGHALIDSSSVTVTSLANDAVKAEYSNLVTNPAGNNGTLGIGIDSFTANSAQMHATAQSSNTSQVTAFYRGTPSSGKHIYVGLEGTNTSGGGNCTFYGVLAGGSGGVDYYIYSGITLTSKF